ncbi:MAG: MipA/OmpV family protein, partial [Gammaproteobacteria bacterium]|nr:MipA/OmpV family protein [Gammaproteobacteria bacterium]
PMIAKFVIQVLLAFVLAHATFATANQGIDDNADTLMQVGEWQVNLAVGLGQRSAIVVGESDFDFYIAPNIAYYGEQFFFDNGALGYTFTQQRNWALSAVTEFNPYAKYFDSSHPSNVFYPLTEGTSSAPDYEFESIADEPTTGDDRVEDAGEYPAIQRPLTNQTSSDKRTRRWSADAGLLVNYFVSDTQQMSLKLVGDVANLHNGWRVVANWSLLINQWLPESLNGQVSIAGNWVDDNNSNYYFGYQSKDANLNYQLESLFIPSIAFTIERPVTKKLAVVVHYKYQSLPAEMTDSPLVVKQDIVTQFLGLSYAF